MSIGLLSSTAGSSIAELFWPAVVNSTSPTIGILEPEHRGTVSGHAGNYRLLALSEVVDHVKFLLEGSLNRFSASPDPLLNALRSPGGDRPPLVVTGDHNGN
jgi:hypothetical protein